MELNKSYASLILAFVLLVLWDMFYKSTCLVLIIPIFVIVLVSYDISEQSIQKRRCFSECYFNNQSIFSKILQKGLFIRIVSFMISFISVVILFLDISIWNTTNWIIMILDSLLLVSIYLWILKKTNNTFKSSMGQHIVKIWAISINAIFLILIMSYINFNTLSTPRYLHDDLNTTINQAIVQYQSDCNITNEIIKINSSITAFQWWMTYNSNILIV